MRICVKYCGGCNPYYDRGGLVNKLIHSMPSDWTWDYNTQAGPGNILLLVAGCTRKCNYNLLPSNQEVLIIEKKEDYQKIENRLNELRNIELGLMDKEE